MEPERLMSIGALSRATGVPADTLRTWERRYGFPAPERTDSGHRRYSLSTLERLRLVVRVLELGHRPSSALGADEATLASWLSASPPSAAGALPRGSETGPREREIIDTWLTHVQHFEGRAFDRELRVAAAEYGGIVWLDRLVAPFLQELGERWARGEIGVRHEHFASERLRDQLTARWRPLSDAATGAVVVLATPPGEHHVLGLHMAAEALALNNLRLVFLGADAPIAEIARAAAQHEAEAVVLSAAQGTDPTALAESLNELRATLPKGVRLVAGGRGFSAAPQGVHLSQNLFDLVEFLVD
jgi:methanogenic corrinoid protein MtbC1